MKRGGRIASNPERQRRLYMRNYHGPFEHDHAELVRDGGCIGVGRSPIYDLVGDCSGALHAAHAVGKARGGDWSVNVCMCRALHDWYDSRSTSKGCAGNAETFKKRTGLDLMAIAWRFAHASLMKAQDVSSLEVVLGARKAFERSYIFQWRQRQI